MKRLVFFVSILLIGTSCTRNPLNINTSGIALDFTIDRFEKDLIAFPIDSTRVLFLEKKYGDFFKIFTHRMIWIGGSEDEDFEVNLQMFATDTLICHLNTIVADKMDVDNLESNLKKAFKHYKYYFPKKEIPQVISCISGFNQSIVTADNLIGISLDKFLGEENTYYSRLGLAAYKRRRMNYENIVPETMMAWAVTEFPKNDNASNLLSNMIYQGKLMYFVDAMIPDFSDTLKIGFTKKQLDFCKSTEASMWGFLVEQKLLFSTKHMDVKRYIDDGPYTNSFTAESPGRTGVWIGWQIVRSYMKKNPKTSLAQLMDNPNLQEILNKSGYQPK